MDELVLCAFDSLVGNHIYYTPEKKITILQKCIELGADINRDDSAILFSAVMSNEFNVLSFLIDNGINVIARNNYALIYACCVRGPEFDKSRLDIIKLLISSGVDPGAYDNAVIRELCKRSVDTNVNIIRLLIENGADPFLDNNILFHRACDAKNLLLVTYLISIGVNCADITGLSIFDSNNHMELKKLVLDNGYNPNSVYNNMSPLESSLDVYSIDSCKLLFEYGADVNCCYTIIEKRYKIFRLDGHNYAKEIQFIDLFMSHGLDISDVFREK